MSHTEHADRIAREREFHNERFANDSARAAAGRFYELAIEAGDAYEAAITDVPAGSRVLEYGAGTGGIGYDLAAKGVEVVGIDISDVAVEHARQAAADHGLDPALCRYEVMDAERLTFPDASFDVVFGSGILHHLDLDRSFGEIARVLKPGGRAVFLEPMGHNPAINLYRRLTPKMRTPDEHPLLVSDIERAGRSFSGVNPEYHVLTTFAAVPFRRARWYHRFIARLNALDASVFRRVPRLSRYAWIVVLQLNAGRTPAAGGPA